MPAVSQQEKSGREFAEGRSAGITPDQRVGAPKVLRNAPKHGEKLLGSEVCHAATSCATAVRADSATN
jgi:hypothetical protein